MTAAGSDSDGSPGVLTRTVSVPCHVGRSAVLPERPTRSGIWTYHPPGCKYSGRRPSVSAVRTRRSAGREHHTCKRRSPEKDIDCRPGGLAPVQLGVATVGTGDDGETPVLDVEVPREARARRGDLVDFGLAVSALRISASLVIDRAVRVMPIVVTGTEGLYCSDGDHGRRARWSHWCLSPP